MTTPSDTMERAEQEVEAYLHRARAMIVEVFGGEPGRDQALGAIHLAAAMVQAEAALRLAAANDRLAAALQNTRGS